MTGDDDAMADPDEARAQRLADYRRAQVRIDDLAGATLVVRPGPSGVTAGPFPFVHDAHVVTAADPAGEVLDAAENAGRHERLRADLAGRGLRTWRTVASDAEGGHAEAGVLVVGLTDTDAAALGRAWGQDAVFRWSRESWSVLPCDGGEAVAAGWTVRAG